jgi:chitin disaccharide deacetylase
LLIVNADDFGGDPRASDRIVECFAAGRITSATAMVHMADSERAAELARSRGLPLGLHLNLTQDFTDRDAPRAVRERQARAARYFTSGGRRRRVTYNREMSALVKRCVADQLDRFRELFGVEPTHIDGHNHAHLSPTALLALPRSVPVRTGQSDPAERLAPKALLGAARRRLIARRQPTTDSFFALEQLAGCANGAGLEELLGVAGSSTVEVMVHPHLEPDYELLMSELWHRVLRSHRLGSFADLRTAADAS